ncbi:MAG: hypothetical protein V3V62_08875, partial [bacterium]
MRIFRVSARIALPLLAISALILGIAGLYGIRAVESYDPFCTACHLKDHQVYLDDGRRPKNALRTLGGLHLSGREARCISCHGEEGVEGMARTTWLASKDLLKFVVGDYEQPSRVFHPIPNKDCLKCHPEERILKLDETDFHAIIDHAELPFTCVRCHSGHRTGGRRKRAFLAPAFVQPRCDSCHARLGQKIRVGARRPPADSPRVGARTPGGGALSPGGGALSPGGGALSP